MKPQLQVLWTDINFVKFNDEDYIIFNWKVSPWKYFRLTEILKIIPWWITEIIYSKENYENNFKKNNIFTY